MQRLVWMVALVALACLVGSVAEAAEFSVRDVDGPMAFAFDGFATVGTSTVPAAAVGRFVADGRGDITDGVRTLVVGGTTLHQTFVCTYTVNPDGTGSASCEVTPGGPETFDFVIVKKKQEAFFTATTPGVTIRGVSRRQH